jgi:hypothetical protein
MGDKRKMTKEEFWNEKKNLLFKEARSYRAFELGVDFSKHHIADLEKENAELKEKYVKNITDCYICDTYCNSQLTKAKEIIREFVEWATWQGNSKCPSFKSIQDKAEQFLSEVEK